MRAVALCLVISLLAAPLRAQDAAQDAALALLDDAQATALAIPAAEFDQWARAMEPVIAERAARGDVAQALAIIAQAPEPSILRSLQIALIKGMLETGDPVAAEQAALALTDEVARNLALVAVAEAMARTGDPAGVDRIFAQLASDPATQRYVVDDVIRPLLSAGQMAAAQGFAGSLADPDQRAGAQLMIGFWLIDQGRVNDAVIQMGEMGNHPDRLFLQAQLIGPMVADGRDQEANLLLAILPPDGQSRALAGVAAAVRDDPARLDLVLAGIANPVDRATALSGVAAAFLRDGRAAEASAVILRDPDPRGQDRIRAGLAMMMGEMGDSAGAQEFITAITDPQGRERAQAQLAGQCARQGDLACAQDVLAQMTQPAWRLSPLRHLIAAGADADGAYLAEALATVRAFTDPKDRTQGLVSLARALREAD